MAQVTVQSKLIRRLCDNVLKRLMDCHDGIIESLYKIENDYIADCKKFDFYTSNLGLSSALMRRTK